MTTDSRQHTALVGTPGYADAIIARLGDRDPWTVQQSTSDALRSAIAGLDDIDLHVPEAPDRWSIATIVEHLVEGELVYGYRMRLIIAGDTPQIQAYDQERWARDLRYDRTPVETALREFEVLRSMNLRMLRELDAEAWERYGVHVERGEESVRRIFLMLAGHDLVHLAQIERIVRSLRNTPSSSSTATPEEPT